MENRDRQIAILNCNTVAAQLAAQAVDHSSGSPLLSILDAWEAAFETVTAKVLATLGQDALMQAFPNAALHPSAQAPAAAPSAPMPTISNGTTVRVIGTQHGDLPAWLIDACQKAGIEKVYDNRKDKDGNDQTQTKRPWFKEAVDKGSSREGVAFWPPRGR